jgi:hypothetical protein
MSLALVLFWLFAGTARAQAQENEEFEKWLKKEEEKLQQFKDERDREFTEFLKREWQQVRAFQGLVPDETPKPLKMPVYQPPTKPVRDTASVPVRLKELPPVPEEQPLAEQSVRASPAPEPMASYRTREVRFFERPVALVIEREPNVQLLRTVNKESISQFWSALSRWNYEPTLKDAQRQRAEMRLNDWGYAQLLYELGKAMFNHSHNEAVLFTWFMLVKSGFDARVGYREDTVYLLVPSNNSLYHVAYFCLGDEKRRFYAVQLNPRIEPVKSTLSTYDGAYPGAVQALDFSVQAPPVLKSETAARTLRFAYDGVEYTIEVKLSKDAVNFFERYPQTNYEVYFAAPPSHEARASLLAQLKSLVQGRTERDAVNMILRFVQTAFAYRTDPEQFGREKPLFPDETLYYPYSDCEDRSILFAYLVRSLFGLEVVGLDYPGHIATAVLFSTEVAGDAVVVQGRRYVICDPTYINADVGVCMPQFKDVKPIVMRIE